jgi:hypothetical protein
MLIIHTDHYIEDKEKRWGCSLQNSNQVERTYQTNHMIWISF